MHKQLMTNISVNFKFYRRSRLLALICIIMITICGLTFIPMIIFTSANIKFEIVRQITQTSSSFITFLIAAMGILSIFHHINSRSIKLVITKPCSLEIWLLSNFVSAFATCFGLYMLTLLISLGLFLVWHIPFQWGLLFVTLDGFFRMAIIFSCLIFLTVIIHPFIAILLVSILNETTFYHLLTLVIAGLKTVNNTVYVVLLNILKYILYFAYLAVPSFSPFGHKTSKVYMSFKFIPSDLKFLLLTFLYTLVIGSLFYFLALFFLKRKRYI